VLPPLSLCHGLPDPDGYLSRFLLATVFPALVLLAAAALCRWRRTAPWWRVYVVVACVTAYSSLVASDLVVEYTNWTVKAKDFQTMWQLLWLLMVWVCSWTLFALDLAEVALVLTLQWMLYLLVTIGSYYKWWVESNQGPGVYSFSSTPTEDMEGPMIQLQQECTWFDQKMSAAASVPPSSPPANFSSLALPLLESASGELVEAEASNILNGAVLNATWDAAWNRTLQNSTGDHEAELMGYNTGHSRTLLDCMLLSLGALLFLLLAARRLNRFEREGFVISWAALGKLHDQADAISGGQVELLALFSNPRLAPATRGGFFQGALPPLRLGLELKALLRAVPPVHLAIEPAASIDDVVEALSKHQPLIVNFSGHGLNGSIAFELPDGSVELPAAKAFVAALRRARGDAAVRLQCIVLNGCDTCELGVHIVSAMPWLRVVCWAGLVEDSAARAFAGGLNDALGTFLAARKPLSSELFELAYWAGIERFTQRGFRFGDPRRYLHVPGHSHVAAPELQYTSQCEGCTPPVHGEAVMLRNVGGEVQIMVGGVDQSGTFSPLCSTLSGYPGASQRRGSDGLCVLSDRERDSMPSQPMLRAELV